MQREPPPAATVWIWSVGTRILEGEGKVDEAKQSRGGRLDRRSSPVQPSSLRSDRQGSPLHFDQAAQPTSLRSDCPLPLPDPRDLRIKRPLVLPVEVRDVRGRSAHVKRDDLVKPGGHGSLDGADDSAGGAGEDGVFALHVGGGKGGKNQRVDLGFASAFVLPPSLPGRARRL